MPEDMTNVASDTETVNPTNVVDNSPEVPISEGVSRDNDASDDAILDRLMGEEDAFGAAVESPTPQPGQSTESKEETVEAQDDTTSDEDTEHTVNPGRRITRRPLPPFVGTAYPSLHWRTWTTPPFLNGGPSVQRFRQTWTAMAQWSKNSKTG